MALQINNPRYGNIYISADSLDELRSVKSKFVQPGYAAIVAGGLLPADGAGGFYVWDDESHDPDDDIDVIASSDGQPGRWKRLAGGDSLLSLKALLASGNVGLTVASLKSVGPVGFNNVAPIAAPTLPAAATDAATTMALANAIRAVLIAYGLAQ